MPKKTGAALKKAMAQEHHKFLREEAVRAMEELLQDKGVPISQTLESMGELQSIVEAHIEGLEDDINSGRN